MNVNTAPCSSNKPAGSVIINDDQGSTYNGLGTAGKGIYSIKCMRTFHIINATLNTDVLTNGGSVPAFVRA